jgi:hypothetical protein
MRAEAVNMLTYSAIWKRAHLMLENSVRKPATSSCSPRGDRRGCGSSRRAGDEEGEKGDDLEED